MALAIPTLLNRTFLQGYLLNKTDLILISFSPINNSMKTKSTIKSLVFLGNTKLFNLKASRRRVVLQLILEYKTMMVNVVGTQNQIATAAVNKYPTPWMVMIIFGLTELSSNFRRKRATSTSIERSLGSKSRLRI